MSDMEFGKCQICGKEAPLERTYYRYPIQCECHSPEHFEVVSHCKDCRPMELQYTKIELKTSFLKNLLPFAMNILINALKEDKSLDSLYYAWQSCIACTIMDNSYIKHEKANEIAIKSLETLIRD